MPDGAVAVVAAIRVARRSLDLFNFSPGFFAGGTARRGSAQGARGDSEIGSDTSSYAAPALVAGERRPGQPRLCVLLCEKAGIRRHRNTAAQVLR